jgi:hypothetical protein
VAEASIGAVLSSADIVFCRLLGGVVIFQNDISVDARKKQSTEKAVVVDDL